MAKKARRLTAAEQKHLEERARVATQLAWQLVTESVKRRPGAATGFPHAEYRKRLAAAGAARCVLFAATPREKEIQKKRRDENYRDSDLELRKGRHDHSVITCLS